MARWVKVPGVVLVNGLPEPHVNIYVFAPGTQDEIPIYSDEGVTPIQQPLKSQEDGTFQFFVDQETYPKIRLYFEKVGVDFTGTNLIYDGITLP